MFTKINLKITNHQKKLIILGDVMQLLSQVTNAKEMLLMAIDFAGSTINKSILWRH